MENEILVLYEQDYDVLSFYDTVTKEALRGYFDKWVKKRIKQVKFRRVDILAIIEKPDEISAQLKYYAYDQVINNETIHHKETIEYIGLGIHRVYLDQVISS